MAGNDALAANWLRRIELRKCLPELFSILTESS